MMQGRRYSEGLHQALEAKEHVEIQPENQTLASITFQNYFRLYKKLAGMTGTAATEANEFMDIYGLDVLEVPTNMAGRSHRRARRGLPHGQGESARHRRRDRRLPPPRPADPGRHHVDREVGAAVGAAEGPQVHPRARPLPQEAGRRASRTARRTSSRPQLNEIGGYLVELGTQEQRRSRSRTRCSTRATTSRKRTSSPRPACPAR